MSCEDMCEGINPSENSTCTLNSQSACCRLEEGKISQNQYSCTASAKNSNCSWKPPVAPKPRHSNRSKSYKSSSSEILPMTPRHQILPQSNNETNLKNGQDTCNGLSCAPHRQVQRSHVAMHPNRVLVLPLPHPDIQLLPLSPPELPPRLRNTPSSGIHHRTHTMIENAKQPPVPPKPKNIPRHSQSEYPKNLQARSECCLTLTQLSNSYSQSSPVQVEVLQGFYGQTRNQTLHSNETYSTVCPKHAGPRQCPPRSSSWSRSRSLTHKALPKQLQLEEYTFPVSFPKEEQCTVPLGAHSQVASYMSPPPNTSNVEDEYMICTAYHTESDCTSVELFPGRHETNKSKSCIPKQQVKVDPPLQQMQDQIKSLQKQVSSLMVRTKEDLSSTEKFQEPTDPTPASGENMLQYSDLKYIMQTLCDLSTWYLLGVYLDVPKGKLDQFHATYSGGPDAVERCKIETICYWLENARKPTWATLAAAVLAMGRRGIVEKISKRFGVRLPICEEREQYETMLVVLPKEGPKMKTLQKEMELKDQEFRLVEQKQGQLEKQHQNLQSELNTVRDLLHFNERLTRKLITDGQRIKSDLTASMSRENSYVRNHSFTMHRKRDRISSLRKEQQYSSSKLEEAQKEQRELWEKLHNLESKIIMTSQELRLLQTQRQSARAALQQQELAINETLVSRTEHQYYNIVIQDGKVEMKLTQQQVETLHRKIADENLKVKQLHEQLQFHQQKLQEVTSQNKLLDRKSQAAAQLEKHQRAYLESTLEADVMQCQIEISTTEYHKHQMENHIHMLRSKMTNLKRRQRQYEQVVIKQKISSPNGKNTDLSYRPQFHSVPRKPHCYYEEVAFDSSSSTESHVHHFHRSHNTHSGQTTPVLGYRAMPMSTSVEQHPPSTTPFIPTPHAPLLRNRSLNDSHRKPHPPLQRFPSAIPYFSHPPFTATNRSAEEDYTGQQPDVIERFDKMGEVENGSKGVSVLNGVIYEPMENYSSHEYNLLQRPEYLPSNNYDSDKYEAVRGWYSETHFTQPCYHDLAQSPT